MDNFLVLGDSKAEALRVRGMVSKIRHRLGIDPNETQRFWEPTLLVDHLGSEEDTANVQLKVTTQQIGKIQAVVRHLLSAASRERRRVAVRERARLNGRCQSLELAALPAQLYVRERARRNLRG
ncbi:hypothetical protein CYMTET_5107 [Cymbomonas tetramitiformis]|uniref:Uncharacterized protein n=1 Tax=Cymbomonas tetramitiformis TaxID=36881 RepID=A0AAE0H044_9CHLO|nr:hypothetical protein CYMTET_5107 [Cymbomonas tetramitiformis]